MVACVLDEKQVNQTVIVFSGKQGLGKTTWMEKLMPKQLKPAFNTQISTEDGFVTNYTIHQTTTDTATYNYIS